MIKPKPSIGSTVYFVKSMYVKYFKYTFYIVAEGIVKRVVTPDNFDIKIDDGSISKIKIGEIHSFEWGGVMTINPRRDKQLMKNAGWN